MGGSGNGWGLDLPLYFEYFGTPGKVVDTPGGGTAVWTLDQRTGGWERTDELLHEILFSHHPEISTSLTRERFVQRTEAVRGRHLSGDLPAFALYALVRDIRESAEAEGRRLTDHERAIVRGLRRETYVMFETELQRRGDPGADPSPADDGPGDVG